MKKRLTYHLNIIGHYLLVGWLLFIAITIMVSLLTVSYTHLTLPTNSLV